MVSSGMDNKLIKEKNIEISYDLIFTALGKEDFFHYQEISGFPSTSITNYYTTAILSMLLIYACLYIGFLMMKERKQGTMKRLQATGLPMASLLLEKILFSSSVIFSFILMFYLVPYLISDQQFNINIVIVYGCAIILVTSFAIFISSVFRNIQNYMIAGNFLCFLLCILGGGIIPIMYLPTQLSHLAMYTPNYWLIKAVLDAQKGTGQEYMFKILIGFFFCSVLFYGLSLMIYGREEAQLAE
jgi:ABC-2 type transport system permease protein